MGFCAAHTQKRHNKPFPCDHPHCVWIRSSHGQASALEEALKDSMKISLECFSCKRSLTLLTGRSSAIMAWTTYHIWISYLFMNNPIAEKHHSQIISTFRVAHESQGYDWKYNWSAFTQFMYSIVLEGSSYFYIQVTQVSTVCKSWMIRHYTVGGSWQPTWYLPAWSDMRCKICSIVVTKPANLASLLCGPAFRMLGAVLLAYDCFQIRLAT